MKFNADEAYKMAQRNKHNNLSLEEKFYTCIFDAASKGFTQACVLVKKDDNSYVLNTIVPQLIEDGFGLKKDEEDMRASGKVKYHIVW